MAGLTLVDLYSYQKAFMPKQPTCSASPPRAARLNNVFAKVPLELLLKLQKSDLIWSGRNLLLSVKNSSSHSCRFSCSRQSVTLARKIDPLVARSNYMGYDHILSLLFLWCIH